MREITYRPMQYVSRTLAQGVPIIHSTLPLIAARVVCGKVHQVRQGTYVRN